MVYSLPCPSHTKDLDKHSSGGFLPEAYSAGLRLATESTVPSWCFFVHEMWLLWRIPLEDHLETPDCGNKEKIIVRKLMMAGKRI